MTRYEELMNKAEKCLDVARITKNSMQKIWLNKAYELKEMARTLSWDEANKKVR